MPAAQLIRIFTVLFVVICSVLLFCYLIDDGLGIGWPQNVLRNWEEYGFLNLGGKLVTNAGGFDITNHPEIYKRNKSCKPISSLLRNETF